MKFEDGLSATWKFMKTYPRPILYVLLYVIILIVTFYTVYYCNEVLNNYIYFSQVTHSKYLENLSDYRLEVGKSIVNSDVAIKNAQEDANHQAAVAKYVLVVGGTLLVNYILYCVGYFEDPYKTIWVFY